jgi:aspartate kinase
MRLAAGAIVLVAALQGVSTEHEVTTLGPEGRDITVVALASALGAESCEIFADTGPLPLPSMQFAQQTGVVLHRRTAA